MLETGGESNWIVNEVGPVTTTHSTAVPREAIHVASIILELVIREWYNSTLNWFIGTITVPH